MHVESVKSFPVPMPSIRRRDFSKKELYDSYHDVVLVPVSADRLRRRYFNKSMLRQLADICLQGRSFAAAESPGLRAAVLSFQNFVIGPDAVKRYFCSSPGAYEDENLVRLNNLRDNPGATHQVRLRAWMVVALSLYHSC